MMVRNGEGSEAKRSEEGKKRSDRREVRGKITGTAPDSARVSARARSATVTRPGSRI